MQSFSLGRVTAPSTPCHAKLELVGVLQARKARFTSSVSLKIRQQYQAEIDC